MCLSLMCRKEHSLKIRQLCVEKRKDGETFASIGRQLGIGESTVRSIVAREAKNGNVVSLPRSGRPKKTSARVDRMLLVKIKSNRRTTAAQLAQCVEDATGVTVSPSLVRSRLHDAGLRGRAARKKPYLTARHRKARLAYACDCLKFSENDWKQVVFSDESTVELTGNAGRVFVWRKPGEEFAEECTVPTFKSGRESVMIWGCITWEGVGALHVCTQHVNAEYYQTILEANLNATITVLGIDDNVYFVQDGAPAHRAKSTTAFLAEKGVKCLKHPAQSPDLNPIENLWSIVKHELSKNPASSREDLIQKLEAIWYDIDPDVVKKLYLSMPTRMAKVMQAKGGHTKY